MNNGFNNGPNNGYMNNGSYQNGSYTGTAQPIHNNWQNQNVYPASQTTQQSQMMSYQTPRQQNAAPQFGDWVDGMEAARVYPFPPGWPPDVAITLWDINEPVFYAKARDIYGRPTPLKKARYTWEDTVPALPGQSGTQINLDGYATKEDLHQMENRIIENMRSSQQAPARANQPQNRNNGGNRE